MKPEFLVLTGDGINCERETALSCNEAGAKTTIMHINELLENKESLMNYHGLCIPGGFSFGDELGSGQVLALKIRHGLMQEFLNFVENKKPIIGICNGFQVLAKLGILPTLSGERSMTLFSNKSGEFIDRWVELDVQKNICRWLKDETSLHLPVRHGEGRVVFQTNKEREIYEELEKKGQIVFKYTEDINGSYQNIAGVCDETGLILGMMPHPEAFSYQATNKEVNSNPLAHGDGQSLFNNIVNFINNS